MHNWPGMPVGQFGFRAGPTMASFDIFEAELTGRGAHAAMPHTGIDPIVAASALVQALQTIASRNVDPIEPAVVTATQIHAGDSWNIIPDAAMVRGTARAFKPEVQDLIERRLREICAGIGAAYGVQIKVRYEHRYPPLVNAAAETQTCAAVMRALVGAENVLHVPPTMGSEDFAFMLQAKAGCYVFIGNGPGAGGCMLHNPHYDFNDRILPLGTSYWAELVEHILAAQA
jgi:hippurate hydrolase